MIKKFFNPRQYEMSFMSYQDISTDTNGHNYNTGAKL